MDRVVQGNALTPAVHLRRRLAGIGLGLLGWGTYKLLEGAPHVAESLVGGGPLAETQRLLSLSTGVVPVSLAGLVALLILARQVHGIAGGVLQVRRGEDRFPRALARGGLRFAQDVGVLVFFFYFLWGFHYARPGLEDHLGIGLVGDVTAEEIAPLARRSVESANDLYREIHGNSDSGSPTEAPAIVDVLPGLEEAWRAVGHELALSDRIGRPHGPPKYFWTSWVMRRLGIGGMYFPFTGEALVLGDLPGVLVGKNLAHEMAHQRGVASESDANVLGFLVARRSHDPRVRYSAYVFLQQQLAPVLLGLAPDEGEELLELRYSGVQRDLFDAHKYWSPARSTAGAVATRANDAMLRSHGVPEGVGSYGGSVWILVALARKHGVEVLF